MGELKIVLPEDIEKKFRRLAMARYGYQKGAMSRAAQEAIQSWAVVEEEIDVGEDPIDAITGLMKDVKKSSVELQHEAWKFIAKKYKKRK
jgi:hypothetical protein